MYEKYRRCFDFRYLGEINILSGDTFNVDTRIPQNFARRVLATPNILRSR